MKKEVKKFGYKDSVSTPEGTGEVQEESTIGEFKVKIPGKGFRWYFPEDLELIEKGEVGGQEND